MSTPQFSKEKQGKKIRLRRPIRFSFALPPFSPPPPLPSPSPDILSTGVAFKIIDTGEVEWIQLLTVLL